MKLSNFLLKQSGSHGFTRKNSGVRSAQYLLKALLDDRILIGDSCIKANSPPRSRPNACAKWVLILWFFATGNSLAKIDLHINRVQALIKNVTKSTLKFTLSGHTASAIKPPNPSRGTRPHKIFRIHKSTIYYVDDSKPACKLRALALFVTKDIDRRVGSPRC